MEEKVSDPLARLAHDFQDAGAELGELIQEQNAAVSQGDFSRLGDIPTPTNPA
jgi:hypothetical protein